MAPVSLDDNCPVCETALSTITDGSLGAKELHVQKCIESHLTNDSKSPVSASEIPQNPQAQENEPEGESCPICNTSYLTKEFDGSASAREAHFTTCFESQSSKSKCLPPPELPPPYNRATTSHSKVMSPGAAYPPEKGAASNVEPTPSRSTIMPSQSSVPTETSSSGSRRFSILGFGGGKNKEEKREENVTKADALMRQRWGPAGSPISEMVRRYWMATRMEQHWEYLRAQHPKQLKKYLDKGYMEPIPVCILLERFSPFIALA